MRINHSQTSLSKRFYQAFTMVEILSAIAIIGVLVAIMVPAIGNYVQTARETADRQTLAVLNEALTRYKTQGGDLAALTLGAPIENILTVLANTIDWNGMKHQVLNSGFTYPANSLKATGSGKRYRFTAAGSYDETAQTDWENVTASDLEVTTWAGNGTSTFVEGNFRLDNGLGNTDIIVNKDGVIYTVGGGNVYKIDKYGYVSLYYTIPGSGEGLALGPDGYLYAAATSPGTIYKITEQGVGEIFAGTGTPGYLDADRLSAQFTYVIGQCWDAVGNMYVTEFNQGRVRKIDAITGETSTIATELGSGIYSLSYKASDNSLIVGYSGGIKKISLADYAVSSIISGSGGFYGTLLDANDNIYFANRGGDYLGRILNGENTYEVLAGVPFTSGHQDGPADTALFTSANQICFDNDGNLLIGERGTLNYIRKVYFK